jgi:hypothetical protein
MALALHQLAPLSDLIRYDQYHAARNKKKLEQVEEFFSSLCVLKALMFSCKSAGRTAQLTYATQPVRVKIHRLTMYPQLSFRACIALQNFQILQMHFCTT